MAENRKLGCLSIFLAVALVASLFINFILAVTALSRLGAGPQFAEPVPSFREVLARERRQDCGDHHARPD